MKKVLKLVKGKREERRECGGVTPSQSGEVLTPGQTPEEEGASGVENGYGYSIDLSGKDKTLTKLHKAAWQGNLEKLKSALKKVEVDAVDRHNRTALHLAVAQGHPNIVWFLLGNNAKTSICDDEGHSPLLKAIECGHKECMTLLLDRGANVNVADYAGNTGLHIAVGRASFDTVSALLSRSADTNLSNHAGDYPLHIATRLQRKDLVDLLLGAGAFVDALDRENRTPLMLAAKTANQVLAHLFVDRGAQLSIQDSNGWTAHDYALLGGHENVASWLSSATHGPAHAAPSNDGSSPPTPTNPAQQHSHQVLHQCPTPEEGHPGAESPEAEPIPPYCQPPRSWEIIQAGMIDENKDGSEPKRRSITALGTLHSRRDSFTEPLPKEHNPPPNRISIHEGKSPAHCCQQTNAQSVSDSDWDSSISADNWGDHMKTSTGSGDSESGTLGRQGTMLGVEELWVANPHLTPDQLSQTDQPPNSPPQDKSFPPPPTALELGVDMARSIRCLKGLSVDQSAPLPTDRTVWRKPYESHSLDCLDEKDAADGLRPHATLHGDHLCKKPSHNLTDVSKRISEQLECYDQALRELAESSRKKERSGTQKYHSLPGKGLGREDWRRMSLEGLSGEGERKEGPEKRRKKHMLLAMREVKHTVQMGNGERTSMDEDVLSPLGRRKGSLDSGERSSGSEENSPLDENPFFGVERQETVLERRRDEGGRESEGSETGEESTLWLQEEAEKKEEEEEEEEEEEDVAEMVAEGCPRHGRTWSFSPLGVIHREIEEEKLGRRGATEDGGLCGEGEEQNEEVVGEQSPDVSLSSGPIEPLGAEKDSGSEPESSHNDVSPPHKYAFRGQHEWLKSHLKAATSEKNKLEELAAQLTEKAERLQYELADAKEAGRSRDEVIQLLQGQLARMEAAYTKSLEESVQSRLQLTSHEQEILHLKELCYRYQEEKEAATSGGGDLAQELQLRIRTLEEEKEKMKEEISNLEAEKSLLEGRLRGERQGELEMGEQCRRWKERCRELEEAVESYVSRKEDGAEEEQERQKREQELERKLAEVREEKEELKAKAERERRKAVEAEKEREELVGELKKRRAEMEREVKRVEREVDERWGRKVREKEEEMRGVMGMQNAWREESGAVVRENVRLRREVEELRVKLMNWKEEERDREREREREGVRLGEGQKVVEEGGRGVMVLGEIMGRYEVGVGERREAQELEYLELKKQILSLDSKMLNEKNMRHSLEKEMMKMRVSLSEKENLEKEMESLKRMMKKQWLGKSGVELLEYERDLQAKRDKYLTPPTGLSQETTYKAKCQLLAKEKEKFNQLNKPFHSIPKTLPSTPSALPISSHPLPHTHPHPYTYSHTNILHTLHLHPQLKNDLDYHLNRSIHRHIQESSSTSAISNTQI